MLGKLLKMIFLPKRTRAKITPAAAATRLLEAFRGGETEANP